MIRASHCPLKSRRPFSRVALWILFHFFEFLLDIVDRALDCVSPLGLGDFAEDFVHRRDVRDLERLVRGNVDVRRDPGAFPISLADRIDRSSFQSTR